MHANHFPGVKAIISLTESGRTPLIMSRIRSGIPIYCYTRHTTTQRRAALFRGVYPMPFDLSTLDPDSVCAQAIQTLKNQGQVASGDWVILTQGETAGSGEGTNSMKILTVP